LSSAGKEEGTDGASPWIVMNSVSETGALYPGIHLLVEVVPAKRAFVGIKPIGYYRTVRY
jgi:hypothetical protein